MSIIAKVSMKEIQKLVDGKNLSPEELGYIVAVHPETNIDFVKNNISSIDCNIMIQTFNEESNRDSLNKEKIEIIEYLITDPDKNFTKDSLTLACGILELNSEDKNCMLNKEINEDLDNFNIGDFQYDESSDYSEDNFTLDLDEDSFDFDDYQEKLEQLRDFNLESIIVCLECNSKLPYDMYTIIAVHPRIDKHFVSCFIDKLDINKLALVFEILVKKGTMVDNKYNLLRSLVHSDTVIPKVSDRNSLRKVLKMYVDVEELARKGVRTNDPSSLKYSKLKKILNRMIEIEQISIDSITDTINSYGIRDVCIEDIIAYHPDADITFVRKYLKNIDFDKLFLTLCDLFDAGVYTNKHALTVHLYNKVFYSIKDISVRALVRTVVSDILMEKSK